MLVQVVICYLLALLFSADLLFVLILVIAVLSLSPSAACYAMDIVRGTRDKFKFHWLLRGGDAGLNSSSKK